MRLLPALQRFLVGLITRTSFIVVVTVIICALFLARAVGSIVAAETLSESPEPTRIVAVAPAKSATPAREKLDGTKIARNIFCSDCEPTPVDPNGGGNNHYAGEPAILIATMLGPDPRATVRVLASEAQGSWGIGERIPGVGTIDQIRSTSIDVVDVSGHRGTISLLDTPGAGGPPKRPTTTVGAATPASGAPADKYADVVRKIADGDYEVERSFVRQLVTGGAQPGEARIVPQMKGSDITGVRLVGVRPGSVATAVGLRSNDQIATINGEPIKNAQQLLDLYAKLDQMSSVELGGTRAGKPLTLTLRLR